MTDEEIMFDFYTVNQKLEDEVESTVDEGFVLEPVAPGEVRTFSVVADKKEFKRWFEEQTGQKLGSYT